MDSFSNPTRRLSIRVRLAGKLATTIRN
uniref:Uncharacterized protein n=1 Tax=Anguilla anguilla TaxID=7936 RepID=A0A0E9RG27_ANGAN